MEDIKKNLGYRFVMQNAVFSTNEVQAGGTILVKINMTNVGYAAPFNPRIVEIVMKNTTGTNEYHITLDENPRLWLTGTFTIDKSVLIPSDIVPGTYKLYLNLPDPEQTLYDNPRYSIRLANENLWDTETGFNDLNFTLAVNATGNSFHDKSIANYKNALFMQNPIKNCSPIRSIEYSVAKTSHIRLVVFNSAGREVIVLVNEKMGAGVYNLQYTIKDMTNGVYFYRMNIGDIAVVKKMLLVR